MKCYEVGAYEANVVRARRLPIDLVACSRTWRGHRGGRAYMNRVRIVDVLIEILRAVATGLIAVVSS
jgi:hypothetical protein